MKLTSFQAKIRAVLVGVAATRDLITYKALGERFGLDGDDDYHYLQLSNELGTISEFELENKRPLISCVVVRAVDGMPGLGFFKFAKALGKMKVSPKVDIQRATFQAQELKETHDYWSKNWAKHVKKRR